MDGALLLFAAWQRHRAAPPLYLTPDTLSMTLRLALLHVRCARCGCELCDRRGVSYRGDGDRLCFACAHRARWPRR